MAVKFTFVPRLGQISRASRRRSSAFLARRCPALVTINAGSPLSVTVSDWPGRRDFNKPGEWKNSRVVNVFIMSNMDAGLLFRKGI